MATGAEASAYDILIRGGVVLDGTGAEGVRLSSRLKQQYPERMTIVLQHQFWDLTVTEHAFEVGLSFKNVPERLYVPFDALMEFYDPSVQFGLKFESLSETSEASEGIPNKPEPKATSPARTSIRPDATKEGPRPKNVATAPPSAGAKEKEANSANSTSPKASPDSFAVATSPVNARTPAV